MGRAAVPARVRHASGLSTIGGTSRASRLPPVSLCGHGSNHRGDRVRHLPHPHCQRPAHRTMVILFHGPRSRPSMFTLVALSNIPDGDTGYPTSPHEVWCDRLCPISPDRPPHGPVREPVIACPGTVAVVSPVCDRQSMRQPRGMREPRQHGRRGRPGHGLSARTCPCPIMSPPCRQTCRYLVDISAIQHRDLSRTCQLSSDN